MAPDVTPQNAASHHQAGATLFAYMKFIEKELLLIPLKTEVDSSKMIRIRKSIRQKRVK